VGKRALARLAMSPQTTITNNINTTPNRLLFSITLQCNGIICSDLLCCACPRSKLLAAMLCLMQHAKLVNDMLKMDHVLKLLLARACAALLSVLTAT
jgi:hypothetical protein